MNMVADGSSSSRALWRSIRREAETALANDPIFGRSLSAAILDHSDLGAAVVYQIGQRLGKSASDRRQFARAANQAVAASPDLVEAAPRSRGNRSSRPGIDGIFAGAHQFQGVRCVASLARVLGSFVTIGDEVTILQNVTIGRNVETPNRARKIGRGVLLSTGNHSRRHQHRRLCQDRRGIGRDVRRAKRLYGGRCTRAPDQLPRTGSSLNPGSVAPNKLAQIPHPVTVRRHRRNPRR
jgi:acetyltransferase-like isoleucine patch superfamily enzyme